jgi:hypothetical protein
MGIMDFISLLQILTFCWHDVHVLAAVVVLVIDMVIIHFISLLCPYSIHSFWNINANPAINIQLVCVISWNYTKGNDCFMSKNCAEMISIHSEMKVVVTYSQH